MKINIECPICGAADTKQIQTTEKQKFGECFLDVTMHMRECQVCLSEFSGAEESKLNKREMTKIRKRYEDLLSGRQIREIREKYRLTQPQAGKIFGGGPVAFCKYENDDVSQSEAMDSLLRLVSDDANIYVKLLKQKDLYKEFADTVPEALKASFTQAAIQTTEHEPAEFYQPKEFRKMKIDGKQNVNK